MFREMRRLCQALSQAETEHILQQATAGVLAVLGDQDYPYTVPLSYVYDGTHLYFHSAVKGHKLDGIRRHAKISFCVIGQDIVAPEAYTTHYKSVVVFGRGEVVTDDIEKQRAIMLLAQKYCPEDSELHRKEVIQRDYARFCIVKITIEHMTGKQSSFLAKTQN